MPLFQGDPVDLSDITDVKQVTFVRKLLRNADAKIEYLVENRAKVKTQNQYLLTEDKAEYVKIYNALRQNAVKQKQLLMDIIENYQQYPKFQDNLERDAQVNTSTLTSAVKKKAGLRKRRLKYTVIPYLVLMVIPRKKSDNVE